MTTKIKNNIVDVPENSDMLAEATKEAKWACEHVKVEYKMSQHLKKKFDEKYGPSWHVVVGKNFSSFVSYQTKNYMFFYEGAIAFLIYKLG